MGICEGAKEDKAGWSGFLKHLKERGLAGVRLIISDACLGLAESAAEFFPDAAWQRCVVHFYRIVFRVVKCQFGYRRARYRGIAKNGAQVFALLALANLYLVRGRLAPA